jgi:hypothetical protein
VARWASGERGTVNQIDRKREAEIGQKKLQPTPEKISVDSTTAQAADARAKSAPSAEDEPQMMSALGSDFVCLHAPRKRAEDVEHDANFGFAANHS